MMWRFEGYGNSIAAQDDAGNTIIYAELASFTEEMMPFARCLVFCLCENSIGSMAGYACMLNAQVVPVMLDKDLDRELLRNLLDTYRPDYIWLPADRKEEFADVETLDANPVIEKYGYMLVKTSYDSGPALYEELALLLTTSGSTGSPKLVRQSYDNIRANTEAIVEYLQLDASERPITTLPMYYTYGLSIINTHLYVGATILLTDATLMQKNFWQFFREGEATSFGGVPYTYEMLKKLRFFRMDLPSLRTMTQAGGKLTPELHAEFAAYAAEHSRKFVVMYGQTEATARMSYLPPERAVEKCGSMGIAVPGGRFTLIDVDGHGIEESDIVGELVYEGPNVTLGYAEMREDLSKGDERHGKLVTGDMAKRDDEGYYYIVGRKKRFLKMFGKRVNLDEVDRLIKAQYDGIDCAASGIDDKMIIFLTDEQLLDEVRTFVADKIHINISAIRTQYLPEIPKSSAGKVLYSELEKMVS